MVYARQVTYGAWGASVRGEVIKLTEGTMRRDRIVTPYRLTGRGDLK
jgi:hypothetical protein